MRHGFRRRGVECAGVMWGVVVSSDNAQQCIIYPDNAVSTLMSRVALSGARPNCHTRTTPKVIRPWIPYPNASTFSYQRDSTSITSSRSLLRGLPDVLRARRVPVVLSPLGHQRRRILQEGLVPRVTSGIKHICTRQSRGTNIIRPPQTKREKETHSCEPSARPPPHH